MKTNNHREPLRQVSTGSGSGAANANDVNWDLSVLTGSADVQSAVALLDEALEKVANSILRRRTE